MGCYNLTCGISGFPIMDDEECLAALVLQRAFPNDCNENDLDIFGYFQDDSAHTIIEYDYSPLLFGSFPFPVTYSQSGGQIEASKETQEKIEPIFSFYGLNFEETLNSQSKIRIEFSSPTQLSEPDIYLAFIVLFKKSAIEMLSKFEITSQEDISIFQSGYFSDLILEIREHQLMLREFVDGGYLEKFGKNVFMDLGILFENSKELHKFMKLFVRRHFLGVYDDTPLCHFLRNGGWEQEWDVLGFASLWHNMRRLHLLLKPSIYCGQSDYALKLKQFYANL